MVKRRALIFFVILLAGMASADFLDEFSSPLLDPGWRVQWNDSAHWSLTERPGFMRIKTLYTNYDTIWNSFYHCEGIAEDFEVRARLICWPDSAGQTAGIFADYDSLFHELPRAVVGIVRFFDYGVMVFGMINDTNDVAGYSDTLVYLRIRTGGDTVFAEYSGDNSNWSIVCWDYGFVEHQVSGIIAFNDSASGGTPSTPRMNADFDWFHLTSLGAVEEEDAGEARSISVRPNPFRNEVYIRAGIGIEGPDASPPYFPGIQIYDAAGKLIKSLPLTSTVNPNPQTLMWNGTDQSGRPVPAGVYFVRGEDSAAVGRIVKIK